MDIEQKLKEYTSALAKLNKQLKELEKEKAEIIELCNKADDKNIVAKMKESEKKFKKLRDAMLELSKLVKDLKKECK